MISISGKEWKEYKTPKRLIDKYSSDFDISENLSKFYLTRNFNKEDILIKELDDTLGSPRRRCPSTKLLDEFTKIYDRTNINNGIEETYNWYMHNKSIYLD